MQRMLISGTIIDHRPIVIFLIGYMYHMEWFHIERCLYQPIGGFIWDRGVCEKNNDVLQLSIVILF